MTSHNLSQWWSSWRTFLWRHNGRGSVSNHQPHDCLLNRLFRRRSKNTSMSHVTGLCAGISPWTDEFSAQMASNAENVSIWWRHQAKGVLRPRWASTSGQYNSKLIEAEWRTQGSLNLAIIGSHNDLSPDWHQEIIWANAGMLLTGPWGANSNEIYIKIVQILLKKWLPTFRSENSGHFVSASML